MIEAAGLKRRIEVIVIIQYETLDVAALHADRFEHFFVAPDDVRKIPGSIRKVERDHITLHILERARRACVGWRGKQQRIDSILGCAGLGIREDQIESRTDRKARPDYRG